MIRLPHALYAAVASTVATASFGQTPAAQPPAEATAPEVVVTAPEITNPDWLRRPAGEDLGRVWPASALQAGQGGQVRLRCEVSANGYLTRCRVQSETPQGAGFGQAALSITSLFQMTPRLVNGEPVTGASVVIPINFSMGRDDATRLERRDRAPTQTRDRALNRSTQAVIYRPAWAAAPTRAEVLAVAPEAGGTATVRCRVGRDGALSNCDTAVEYPDRIGLGPIAERLATSFRVVPPEGLSGAGNVDVDVPIDLSRNPPAYVLRPGWRATPTSEQLQGALEPVAAAAPNRQARAEIDCLIAAGGALSDCRVLSADPEPAGPALLSLAPQFTAGLWTEDGYAAVGSRVRLPLRYVAD